MTEKKPALIVFMISSTDLAPLIIAIEARYTIERGREGERERERK